ncbi:MAG: hypothetical protein ACYDHU_00215 [Acidimicrobiales bacterium]
MAEPSSDRSWARKALDLMVFAPVGLVTSAREELPLMAVRGREQFAQRINNARVVGEFVVTHGRDELARRLAGFVPSSGARADGEPGTSGVVSASSSAIVPPAPEPAPAPLSRAWGESASPIGDVAIPPALNLAIPDYDTLSASQVVRRLDGLSPFELETVRRYESTSRRRRTVLHRVEELHGRLVSDQPDGEV